MSKYKIVSLLGFPEQVLRGWFSQRVDPSLFDVVVMPGGATEEEICDLVEGATVLLKGPGKPFVNRRILEAAEGVRLVQFGSVGYADIDLDAATELGIPVANNPGWNSIAVAEHAIMAMLVLLKKTFYTHEALSRGISVKDELRAPGNNMVWELYGKTLGILGLGNIGSQVAERARAFGPKILYNKRSRLTKEEEEQRGVEYRTFDQLLEESDVLTVHVPLYDDTRGMIGRKQMAKMKKGAILINTARRDIVDEDALAEALREDRLSGAALDVPREPDEIPVLHEKFAGVKNILYTPHMSGGTRESMARAVVQMNENTARLLNGEKPFYLVNDVWE
jgi:phosphoglycerate dehydrogenase-like enzyme